MDNMNCLSARRIITTDIKDKSPALAKHLAECPSCRAFYERQVKFNHKLKEAMEIEVPEGLTARILVEQRLNQKKSKAAVNQRWLAMAASVMLVVAVAFTTSLTTQPAIAGSIIEHIIEEEELLHAHGEVAVSDLNALLNPHGVQVNSNIGRATHASNCVIEEVLSAHIVFEGKNKPVTMVIVPKKLSDKVGKKINIDDQQFEGMLVAMQKGTLALLSEDKESLVEFERRLRSNLTTYLVSL